MAFFRREHRETDEAPRDSPAALRARLDDLVVRIHFHAGQLPVESVVAALAVTDVLSEVVDEAEQGDLDTRALVTLESMLDDYLPTTMRTFLSLDPSVQDVVQPSGHSPRQSLHEQLDALGLAADDLLRAARSRDADALLAQGSFLRTKFTGSDLDL